ncbi:MAG: rhodanese-like domain-containing protein [Clostridiales bacterium]|nr:rhodanese-like domain-containing protein [Clostridiales bacterium]
MKKLVWILIAIAAVVIFVLFLRNKKEAPAPGATESGAVYHKLTPEAAKERMDSGDVVTVVDVRTAEEFAQGHIAKALLIPNEAINTEKPALLPDLDAEILIYCRSGRRSKQAAEKLVAMGYTAVYDFGGIIDWPYETVTD